MDNNTFYAPNDYRIYLEHHGIKGMKWGVRRFQNKDGSLTSAGKARQGGIKGLVKRKAENYKNYRNYKEELGRGDRKYDVAAKRSAMENERQANEWADKHIFDDEYGDRRAFGTRAEDSYYRAVAKAKKYADDNFMKKYGSEKLEQAKRTQTAIAGAEATAIILGGIGVIAANAYFKARR